MYHALTDVEWANAAHVLRQVEFELNIQDKFGPETTLDDFPDLDIPNTPEHENFNVVDYAGQDDKWMTHWHTFIGDRLADELAGNGDDEIPTPYLDVDLVLPTPGASENYINAFLLLSCGNLLACGTVMLEAIPLGTCISS